MSDLEKIRSIGDTEDLFDTKTLDIDLQGRKGADGMAAALERLCERAEQAVVGRLQHHRPVGPQLGRTGSRSRAAGDGGRASSPDPQGASHLGRLVVESGEPREVHHFCCLAGYGAEAINPYLAFDTLLDMHAKGDFPPEVDRYEVVHRYIKSIGKGILKVMSKMGISTYQSYCGAQIFDAVGLSTEFVNKYFTGTATTIEGIGLAEVAEETVRRHSSAFSNDPVLFNALEVGGEYLYRVRGEEHVWTPDAVATLQHSVRRGLPEKFREYAAQVNADARRPSRSAGCSISGPPKRPAARRCRSTRSSRLPRSSSGSRPAR
jgi:glutamate synthase (NADPH/NADH) large chain